VFIKLTTQVSQAVIVGGLENDVSRNLDSIQDGYLGPLGQSLLISVVAGMPALAGSVAKCLSEQ
jgi:hypothetical protein